MSTPSPLPVSPPQPQLWWKLMLLKSFIDRVVLDVSSSTDWAALSETVSGLIQVDECTVAFYKGMRIGDAGSWAALNAELRRAHGLAASPVPVALGKLSAICSRKDAFQQLSILPKRADYETWY
ncbi:hypothetical protein FA95DRAFT_1605968 [Auriscalpium vulgare]|uniref:Uncharacterized protein n=1 Tax=Auriscalpium vulgare TaxID=40419 RepID=A0ACB8RTL1_9AGAM|nr:hypothetical protein FA95DRAFT_1605968 [Auriscalpium vulgare]